MPQAPCSVYSLHYLMGSMHAWIMLPSAVEFNQLSVSFVYQVLEEITILSETDYFWSIYGVLLPILRVNLFKGEWQASTTYCSCSQFCRKQDISYIYAVHTYKWSWWSILLSLEDTIIAISLFLKVIPKLAKCPMLHAPTVFNCGTPVSGFKKTSSFLLCLQQCF